MSPLNGRFKFALFDLDNTLADRVAAVRHLAARLYDSDLLDRSAISIDDAIELFVEFDQDGHAPDKVRFFGQLAGAWDPMTRSPVELAEWYLAAPRDWYEPDPEIVGFLADITAAGTRLGIITNGSATQFENARLMGLATGAKCVLVSDVFGAAKPDPSIFLEALRELGGPVSGEVLFVGDNPEADIGGAQGVGMATAWIRRGCEWPPPLAPPDFVLESVLETRRLLAV